MRKYKRHQLNKYTDHTYRFFNRILDKPITSKILRLAAELNEATNNEIATALILSNKCMLFSEELQYFDGKWGDTANAESEWTKCIYDRNIIMKRPYLIDEEQELDFKDADEYQTGERGKVYDSDYEVDKFLDKIKE